LNKELSIKIAGAAGQGMQTVGFILGKVLTRSGYQVFAIQDNESRIRGGHNFSQVRVSEKPVYSMTSNVDILIAFDENSITIHQEELSESAVIIFDDEQIKTRPKENYAGGIPLERLSIEKGGDTIYSNTVALGAAINILGLEINTLETFLNEFFSHKKEVREANSNAARAGYDYALQHLQHKRLALTPQRPSQKMFINGHEAVALGALAAGCQFVAAYPMSPATSILTYLAEKADEFTMVVEQAEDEIAAVNMAIGASFSGVRAMTTTSGGGFSLMVESLGLAGISETPLVVVNAQRPGPATGLPTRTEQGDLRFVLHASQGEFPRVILAPATAREAFYFTIKAFHLADRYQVPVVILTDQHLGESFYTEEKFDLSAVKVNRFFPSKEEISTQKPYLRYRLTEKGVSPRIPPSWEGVEAIADSHEHQEDGHITEDAHLRSKMVEKRFKKMEGIIKEGSPPLTTGSDVADVLVIGWGSTYGVIKEAVACLVDEGHAVRLMHLQGIWPFPKGEVIKEIKKAKKWIVVENNYTSQLAGIIQEHTCLKPSGSILKYDGRPFFFEEVHKALKKEV
jgi:2-oxoglutarate ferredoxin oxidoreductase subunit alpha